MVAILFCTVDDANRLRATLSGMRFLLALLLALNLAATEPNAETKRWWNHIKQLASDRNEGRDTGSSGYVRAEDYVIKQLMEAGVQGTGSEGFRQPVPLERIRLDTKNSNLEVVRGSKRTKLNWLRDATLATVRPDLPPAIDGNLYFVGDGESLRPGAMRKKVVVLLSQPRFSSAPPNVKPEALSEAAAVFSIDTSGGPEPPRWPAAYATAYRLIEESRPPLHGPVHFRVNPDKADILFANSTHSLAELQSVRASGAHLPNLDLDGELHVSLKFDNDIITSDNIIGTLPGSDPTLRDQYVVLSAHLDGYGRGEPWKGDSIYNGAFDDAAYVATLIDLAQNLKDSGIKPKRSLLFCIVTGEEKGLLGSKFFALHPTAPKQQLVADLNLDQLRPIFPLRTLTVLGLDDSTLGAQAKQVAESMNIRLQPDPEPERGLLRRSDHYSFMQIGVPALNFVFGYQKGTEDEAIYRAWYAERYHSPADDLEQPWVPEAAAKFNQFYQSLAMAVANAPEKPAWAAGSKFATRETPAARVR